MSGNPSRVRITYDVETGGVIEKKELPFVIGIFADLSGDPDLDGTPQLPLKQRRMMEVDRDSFDGLMVKIAPRVALGPIDDALSGTIVFSSLEDFSPAKVADKLTTINVQLGRHVAAVMHADNFRKLEAAWRGLHYLVSRAATGAMLKLRVLDASKKDLADDLVKAVAFDQSALFKLIHDAEYGTYGGTPYGLLVGAYEFSHGSDDVRCLGGIAAIAAASHAPFIAAADSGLFGLSSFSDLSKPRDLKKIFESDELSNWQDFRASEDSRYVTLTLPRVLLRLPFDAGTKAGVPEDFLWGNAAFVLAERIADAFTRHGWPGAIRGTAGGGLVEELPTCVSNQGEATVIGPTEVSITQRRAKELDDLGFMAICRARDGSKAVFFGAQTAHRPPRYIAEQANIDARISSLLPYVLAESRFAHYLAVIMREKIGSFLTRATVETYLNSWISQYVLLDGSAPENVEAAYPLRAASIVVTDAPGNPGAYKAAVFLKPHYQFEGLTGTIRFVEELPA